MSQPPARGWIDPNWPPPGCPGDATIIIYGYTPSIILGVLGCVLFFLSGLAHGWQLLRNRNWYFSTIMIGITFEVVGYVFRCLSAKKNPYKVSYFVVQYFFIVVAPVFFAAAIYTVLSVLINATGRHYAPIKPKLILWIFITCDIIATIVQVLGAALIGVAASNRRDTTTPNNILLGGLAFQAITFLGFIVLFGLFVFRAKGALLHNVSKAFYISFSTAVLLFYLRVCFRLSETSEGLYGKLNTHEVYFGTLEFMPVVLAVCILAVWYPGRCIPKAVPTDIGDVTVGEEKDAQA